jgi:hypothetical protein
VNIGTNPADTDFNSSFNVIDRLCSLVKNMSHTIYMDRWFSIPKLFDHLWASSTKAAGTATPNKKEMPKQAFSKKLKKGRKSWHIGIISWP